MNAEDADLFHRINDALSGKETPLTSAFYKAVAVFGWPSPVTLGCLLALVREAHSQPLAFVRFVDAGEPWSGVGYWHVNTGHTGSSEAETLVIALEAAP